ncbi:hypothetical protein L1887_19597 [Cichorium endivia]|nr:hypothetical protein L1887_19597 [Cichorium endivia]
MTSLGYLRHPNIAATTSQHHHGTAQCGRLLHIVASSFPMSPSVLLPLSPSFPLLRNLTSRIPLSIPHSPTALSDFGIDAHR